MTGPDPAPAPPSSMVPFTVVATMQQGAALDARFGVALDGMLAGCVRAQAKRRLSAGGPVPGSLLDGGLHVSDPAPVDLPLARCTLGGSAWHWAATTADPIDFAGQPLPVTPDPHHLTARLDHRRMEVTAEHLPMHLPMVSGRYRNRRLPVVVFPAAALRWRGVGDPDRVADLLAPLASVGARRGGGEGAVLSWSVTAHPEADAAQFAHLHADARWGRPCPAVCATAMGVDHVAVGPSGLRPPYWHSTRQQMLALPGYLGGGVHAQA